MMVGGGYERDASSAGTTETGDEVESSQGFVLQDNDGGDKFVVKVTSYSLHQTADIDRHNCADCKRSRFQHVCVYHDCWQLEVSTRAQYLCSGTGVVYGLTVECRRFNQGLCSP